MTEHGKIHTDGSRSGGQPVTNDKDSAVLADELAALITAHDLRGFSNSAALARRLDNFLFKHRRAFLEALRQPTQSYAQIIAAINAIPAVTVTDDMVERAAITHWNNDGAENEMLAWEELDQHDRDFLIKSMKDALVAALGE